jgi:outer membrane protein assembly factor BamA
MAASLLAALLLAAAAADPGAGAEPPADGAAVTRVEIEGNRRTTGRAIRRALRTAPGDPYRSTLPAELTQRLLNLRLFRTVSVEAQPEPGGAGVALRVRVVERVTVVPVPALFASRGVFTAGLTVLDANLLGGGEMLAVAALGSNRGASAFASFRDPGVADTRWLLSADAQAHDTRRERYEERTLAYTFRDRRVEAGAAVGWRLDDRWAVRAGWFESRAEALATPGSAPPPRAGAVRGPTAELELDAAAYRLYYAAGISGRVRLREGVRLADSGRRVRQVSGAATWSSAGPRDHAVSLAVAVDDVRGDPVLDAVRLGGRPGSRGFVSGGLWAETAATAAAEYQVPVWRPGWGVVTVAGFADAGLVRWRGEARRYVAPGAGFRVYLRNVAIPVLGFDVAWASGMPGPVPSVLLGLRG